MANGAFKFKDSYGNTLSFISGSGSNISFSGGTLDLSGMTGLTLGNLTLSGTTQNAISASHAASYLLTSSFNTYTGTTDTVIGTLQTSTGSLNSFTSSATTRLNSIEGVSGSYATTGSNQFKNDQVITGSLTVTGFIDAQELRTTYISSSILYRSGSTKFGDELGDTHSFTGSLSVSGSISVPGSNLVSGSAQILNGSGVFSGSAQLPSGIVSGSAQTIANLPSGTVSGSVQIDVMSTTNIARLATTGSNTFTSNQIVSGSITTTSNVGVGGSPSGTYGTLSVFGGISIKDNNNAKLEIGRYSSGVSNSYIKLGTNSNSLRFTNAGDLADIMELTNSGNLGLGVTPSSWASDWTVFQIGSMSSLGQYNTNNSVLLSNNYYNATTSGAGPRYIANGSAGVYQISSGVHYWYNAVSGTANAAMTLTNTMTLNNSGHLGLAVTPSSWGGSSKAIQIGARMSVYNDGFNNALFGNNTYYDGSNNIYINTAAASRFYLENTSAFLWQQAASGTAGNTINFTTAMTLNASGNLGLGTTDTQTFRLAVDGPNVSQGDSTTTIRVFDTTSATTGTGGGISFAGYFSGTSSIINTLSYIKGGKENSTGGDYASYLSFGTRINGASPTEKLRITSVGTVQPAANGTQDLGTASLRWSTVYTSDLSMSNGIGDYTIVEGLEDLFLYNNKTNKVFKFMLQEVNPSEATPKKS